MMMFSGGMPVAAEASLRASSVTWGATATRSELAGTSACANQAFMVGDHAMAWQFHLEVDAARIEQWLIGHTGELRQAGIDIAALRRAAGEQRAGLARALDAVLSDWFTCLRL